MMIKYLNSNKGSSFVGAGLLIGLIAAVSIGSVVALGEKNSNVFKTIVCNINSVFIVSEEDCSLINESETTENLPPEITTTSLSEAYYLVPYNATLTATDPDSGSLTWTSSSMIDGLSLDSSGNLTGSPTLSGIRNMNISVSDGSGNSDNALLDLIIRKEKLVDISFKDSDEVGSSLALDGNYAALGSKNDDDLGSNSGAVYVFDVSDGELLRKITPESDEPGSEAGDEFGYSLAIDSTRLVIGSRKAESGGVRTGVVYMYDITTGTKIRKFVAPDGENNDNFGGAVAINGDYVIVGAPGDDDGASLAGAVYVFEASTGNFIRKLNASNPAFGDALGSDVAVNGDYVVASAQSADADGSNSGGVYLFQISTGQEIGRVYPDVPTGYDLFEKVTIGTTHFAVGARSHNANGVSGSGAIFVYSYNPFSIGLTHKLVADDIKEDLFLGRDVQLLGNYLFAGSTEGAYIFDLSDGSQMSKITRSINNGVPHDEFGANIAVSGNTLLVSAHRDETSGSYAGAAYVFNSDETQRTWISNAID